VGVTCENIYGGSNSCREGDTVRQKANEKVAQMLASSPLASNDIFMANVGLVAPLFLSPPEGSGIDPGDRDTCTEWT
jgi:hypothetical protein